MMNERLKQLAEQAGMRFDRFGMVIPTTLTVQETVNLEKFAELIVQECAKACEENSYLALNGWQRAKQILEHFGVE